MPKRCIKGPSQRWSRHSKATLVACHIDEEFGALPSHKLRLGDVDLEQLSEPELRKICAVVDGPAFKKKQRSDIRREHLEDMGHKSTTPQVEFQQSRFRPYSRPWAQCRLKLIL